VSADTPSILIVNPNQGSRTKLREALKRFHNKSDIYHVGTPKEAHARLEKTNECDILFLTADMGQDKIKEFIESIKSPPLARIPWFVVAFNQSDSNIPGAIAALYLIGVTGFITEPYSTDELETLLRAVQAKEKERARGERFKQAVEFLLTETMSTLDKVSRAKENEQLCAGFKRDFKKIAPRLLDLKKEDAKIFDELFFTAFENAKPPSGGPREPSKIPPKPKKKPVHPGVVAQQLLLKKNLTLDQVAASLKKDLEEFQLLLDHDCSVTDTLAADLAKVFDTTPDEWIKLQKEFDESRGQRAS
jgi:antitoxin HigA-1